ncbi:hypothetical protein [Streptomyces alanosinicus]|uniref:Uncharacterized protein n=1 Tax=Streptomyces alanosinicus TaxID=68171 RepID=A0A918YN47_9ACTN|nr:hypothetical protein [Streptomyces alanosinicus]GHE08519.1 hypothetical protein GCM10010339_57540 [Streptomyces alanosinicus]
MSQLHTPDHPLGTILSGAPLHLLTQAQRTSFDAFCQMLEQIGREGGDDEPLVHVPTLRTLTRAAIGDKATGHLLAELTRLPGHRLTDQDHPRLDWFTLADRVPIFDPTPASTFTVPLVDTPHMGHVINAVHTLYPSLEPELIDPQLLPARLTDLPHPDHSGTLDERLRTAIDLVHRNLGWWAAFTLALMTIAAAGSAAPGWAAWPLHMYVLAALIGGWTLTVVGGCALATPY